tara:strand:- start:198 stop:1310 length:1113 start_codon:yes stop_codon:yes gene_type:complete
MQMNSQKAEIRLKEISVVGGGIAGITTAFHLGRKGYKVNLIDPIINSKINNSNPKNGTQASLGVLMGNVYKRSKGRAFFLRNKSMELWKEWLTQINYSESKFVFKKPLIKLTNSEKEYQSMIEISNNKKKYGIELLDQNSLNFWNSVFEKKLKGGLISHEDGRLNPIKLVNALMQSLERIKINKIAKNVIKISKNNNNYDKRWNIELENNQFINQDYIVICSALNTQKLLKPLGHEILLEPILGQVFELELKKEMSDWREWPAILNYQSVNFIHQHPNQILIGATLERGNKRSLAEKKIMLNLNNNAPEWMRNARVRHEWSGVRARPIKEPAPLLKQLEPGLLINTGHYRNGVLLAPACADWIRLKIEDE